MKNFGEKLGYFLGMAIISCVVAIVIALTAKFITWIF